MSVPPQDRPQETPAAGRVRFAFLVLAAFGLLLFALLPARVTGKLGLTDHGVWFLDTHAILASSDAVQAGLDPTRPNPLDVYGRPHSYSSWWFGLGAMGLTRDDTPLVGGVVTGMFLLAAGFWLNPRRGVEALLGVLAVLSPVVLLAFNRANNDLVVFALLAAGLLGLRDGAPWRVAVFGVAVVVATGLKFYPVIAAVALLTVGPVRLRRAGLGLTLGAAALVLWSQWDWLQRAVIPVPTGVYLFGAGVWWRELGLTGWGPPVITGLLLWLGAAGLVRAGWCRGLADSGDEPTAGRAGFAAGAVLLLGCWLAGISYAYRWVFALLLLPWLWRRLRTGDRAARVTAGMLFTCLWLDGLFCLGTNLFIGAMPLARLQAIQHHWQLVTQPVVWGLMLLLAGWLWELLLARWRELPVPGFRPPGSPRALWLLLLALGWMTYVQSDRLREACGLPNSETWFLDSYAVLAASDAHRAGLDAAAAGPFDPLGRPHRYSDWWYGLGRLGLTRDDNFIFGLACVVAAVAAVAATVRPAGWRAAVWALLVLLSPGVFLGFNRANNDLVVFALLGGALVALREDRAWRHAVAAVAVALATALKFYPVVAVVALVIHHLRAGRGRTALASVALAGLALLAVWPQMTRGRFPVEVSVHVWGARIWPQDLGLGTAGTVGLIAVGAAVAIALAFGRPAGDRRPLTPVEEESGAAFLLAATVLVACFLAGSNYGYRWIFAIWLGPWLLARWDDSRRPGWQRRAVGLAWILVPLVLWLDGLLCLLVNTGGLVAAGLDYAGLQFKWRLLTQPFHWLLLVLLAGWLLEAVAALVRGYQTERRPAG